MIQLDEIKLRISNYLTEPVTAFYLTITWRFWKLRFFSCPNDIDRACGHKTVNQVRKTSIIAIIHKYSINLTNALKKLLLILFGML